MNSSILKSSVIALTGIILFLEIPLACSSTNPSAPDSTNSNDTIDTLRASLLWKFETPGIITSSPAIGNDSTVYFGSTDNYILALSPDGTLKWSYLTGGGVYFSSPAVDENGRIYVGSRDSSLYVLEPNGTLSWKYQTGDQIVSSPAIGADGTIYMCSDQLYSIDNAGTLKWSDPRGGGDSSPAIGSDGTIYLHAGGSSSGEVLAFNPEGAVKWVFSTNGGMTSPAIGADGAIYVGSSDHHVYAFEPDGTLRWEYITEVGMLYTSPAIGEDGSIYIGTTYGRIYVLNPDGSLKWRFTESVGVESYTSSPAIGSDGTVYFYQGNNLCAVSAEGDLLWKYPLGHWVMWANRSSPTITGGGIVYIGGMDGYFYALQSSSPGLMEYYWPKFRCNIRNTGRRE